jgi:hypothetical protein
VPDHHRPEPPAAGLPANRHECRRVPDETTAALVHQGAARPHVDA